MKFGYLHTRMNADIAREINAINHILATVPFRNTSAPLPYFLDTYKLQYEDMVPINDANKFPIEPNKLLKLGISLGNLIKTLKLDEEMHQEQQQRQSLFIASLNNSVSRHPSVNHSLASIKSPVSGYYDPYDPFHGERQSSTVTNSANNQSLQHVKFVKNLLLLLKNFDIGTTTSAGKKLHELSSKASNLSLSKNSSPIKLNSRQLLIEKLEINISLDVLFIYKITMQLVLSIYVTLQSHIAGADLSSSTDDKSSIMESSSIFSSNSLNSSNDSILSADEYVRILHNILARISTGLIEPFLQLMLLEVVKPGLHQGFQTLVDRLS